MLQVLSCIYWNNQLKKDRAISGKYLQWKNKHVCQKNFSESSGKMESTAAVMLWERSLEKKLRYVAFVGEGDSAAHKAVCSLNSGDGPYGTDYPVVKEECLNHVSKRLGIRLRTLKKKLAEPGKLTDEVIDSMASYYATTVRRFVEKGGDRSRIKDLAAEIMATFLHISSCDKDPRHFLCPRGEDSWCFYKRAEARNETIPSHNTMKIRISITSREDRQAICAIY